MPHPTYDEFVEEHPRNQRDWRKIAFKIAHAHTGKTKTANSQLGHVWMAPWQELSDAAAALVGCGHVSGLLMRRGWPLT